MKKILLFSALLLALIVSCHKPVKPDDEKPPDEIANAIWPFHENSFWEFDVWEVVSGEDFDYFEKYHVEEIFADSGKRVAKIKFTKYTEDTTFAEFTFWWGNKAEGLFEFAPFGDVFSAFDEQRLLFKFPATDMDSFQTYSWDFTNPYTMLFFDIGIPTMVVPAGSFEGCVGYQLHRQVGHEPPVDNYYYFKPDTGYIRYEKYEAGSLVKTRSLKTLAITGD